MSIPKEIMFGFKKYTLLPAEPMLVEGRTYNMHRIVASRDIPTHKVKRGDLGGYVSGKKVLEHRNSCWIADDAVVIQDASQKAHSVKGSVLIKDKAVVINSKVHTLNPADVIEGYVVLDGISLSYSFKAEMPLTITGTSRIKDTEIIGTVHISENVTITSSKIIAKTEAFGAQSNVKIDNSTLYGGAVVIGDAIIKDSVLHPQTMITDNAQIEASVIGYQGIVRVQQNAKVSFCQLLPHLGATIHVRDNAVLEGSTSELTKITPALNGEQILITDNVFITESLITGSLKASGKTSIKSSAVSGNNQFSEEVHIGPGAALRGKNKLSGTTIVPFSVVVDSVYANSGELSSNASWFTEDERSKVSGGIHRASVPSGVITSGEIIRRYPKSLLAGQAKPIPSATSSLKNDESIQPYLHIIKTTSEEYDSYTNDIVKLLKYPAMADSSIPETRDLMVTARKARRELLEPTSREEVQQVAKDFEAAFVIAENKALTLSLSHLDDKAKASLKDASQFLSLARNEAATANERTQSLKAGIRSLEGVLHVSDTAIHEFKAKSGLLELES